MPTTSKLGLQLLQNGSANQVLGNDTFAQLNQLVQAAVTDRLSTPPGSPANEALYLITATATGAWAGKENQLAYWLTATNAWQYVVPREGMLVHVNDEDQFYKYDGAAWGAFSSGGGGGAGAFRNKLINPNFLINQTKVSGSVVLAAGAYGHDGWKAGAAGCTYTFSTTNNVTTVTISAGSLTQVLEGNGLQSGTHTLSWTGTAQGRVNGGTYAASPVAFGATGGSNATVEFNTGTVSLPQFEPGGTATAFELRPQGVELQLCYRYRYVIDASNTTGPFTNFCFGEVSLTADAFFGIEFPTAMRTSPSISFSALADFAVVDAGAILTLSALQFDQLAADRTRVRATTSTSMTLGHAVRLIANNNNVARIIFNAGL